MLPKPIKNLKSNSSEQLNLEDSISAENKLKNKRRAVLIFLVLTVGLSFVFWTYRSVNLFIQNPTLPQISFNLKNFSTNSVSLPKLSTNKTDLSYKIDPIIEKDTNNWSIYVEALSNQETSYSWAKNSIISQEEIYNLVTILSQSPVSTSTLVSSVLPPGVQVQENSILDSNSYQLQTLITVPQQQFVLVFKVSGDKVDTAIKLIPEIIEKIYWHLIQQV